MGFTQANLQKLTMAAPCPASWHQMTGDDRIRHCGACDKRVFNLSTMTLHEVAELMQQDGPRPCLRFYLRKDGTVMTDDCPVGLRRLRRRAYLVVVAMASLLGVAYVQRLLDSGSCVVQEREQRVIPLPFQAGSVGLPQNGVTAGRRRATGRRRTEPPRPRSERPVGTTLSGGEVSHRPPE